MAEQAKKIEQLAAEVENLRQNNESLHQKLALEAVLERVRVAALGMQNSEDLVDVSSVLFDEFSGIEISPLRSAITIWSEAEDKWQSWVTRTIVSKYVVYENSLKKVCAHLSTHREGLAAWRRGESHLLIEYAGRARTEVFHELKAFNNHSDEWLKEALTKATDPFFFYQIFFSEGALEIGLGRPLTDGELQVVKRLADVFDIAYRRYGELLQLEKQNKDLENNLRLLRETQNQLVLQEKMASLGDLVAGVAHEINTPLGAIGSMHHTLVRAVDKLQQELGATAPGDKGQPLFEVIAAANRVIADATERVSGIVDSLRNFARLDQAEFQVVDLHEGIDSALTLLETQLAGRIKIVKNYGDIPPVHCAPGQLNQVFMHLLKNGLEAIEGPGQITISSFVADNNIHLRFSDTGRGMAPDQVERLFDFDFQAAGQRVKMGFGLAADLKILQDHKGELKVSSQPGQGTQMTVVLPVSRPG